MVTSPQMPSDTEEDTKRREAFLKVLEGEDDLGVVLRTHIYLTKYLDEFITLSVKAPNYYKPKGVRFEKKLEICMMLGMPNYLEKPMTVFNNIRNEFGHEPERKLTKTDVDHLFQAFRFREQAELKAIFTHFKFEKTDYKKKTIQMIIAICASVSGYIKWVKYEKSKKG